ncbi:uncharacterized protein HKW66_Vig0106780 [Vigna angularis]|uniref:Uncharacterized protein n=1 Tax=Phaseolus angularis TaxID=3914 RepID=A0A8T0KXY2_PHAAN|nr:uncharacterized protein HKW66_Vig0106780 [Vigna angularis]
MKVDKGGKQLPPSPPFRSRRRRSKVRLQCQEEHREEHQKITSSPSRTKEYKVQEAENKLNVPNVAKEQPHDETKGHEPNVTSKREVQNYSLVGIPKLMPS